MMMYVAVSLCTPRLGILDWFGPNANTYASMQVRKFVIRREVQPKGEGKKPYTKAPKIQRLVTPQRLQHKRHRMALKRRQAEASKDAAVSLDSARLEANPILIILTQNEYAAILAKRVNEEKAKKSELRKRRASSMRK